MAAPPRCAGDPRQETWKGAATQTRQESRAREQGGRMGQAAGVQADGEDGSQEMAMQDMMLVPVPAGGTPGWDQMSSTGVNPFQLLNPLAEEIGSTALP